MELGMANLCPARFGGATTKIHETRRLHGIECTAIMPTYQEETITHPTGKFRFFHRFSTDRKVCEQGELVK
jgi:hypothetical protein